MQVQIKITGTPTFNTTVDVLIPDIYISIENNVLMYVYLRVYTYISIYLLYIYTSYILRIYIYDI